MMDGSDLITIRTALLITLSILLILVTARRFRRSVMAKDMPAALHVELLSLDLAYHPARLLVSIQVPGQHIISTRLLNAAHVSVHEWAPHEVGEGEHAFVRDLPELADGEYSLELYTSTQRTVRRFRLNRT